MSREIKFRAWDKINEKIVKISSLSLENKEIAVKENGTYHFFRMQNLELMQYTGVKDKNGKEIYEGDIYHVGDKNIRYLVVWFDSGFEGKQLRSTSYAGLESWAKDIEVLGNIYENLELLENNND
ncbi:YopX family protein [Leptotrichia sp. oral taxon 847]|uniref:YopX family protein n=1 Tax=Leptotrichia sp. oral taxon 847 TaxID=1785996 RepID=UPI000767E4E3|nr:YopX family protein [Leptotrichia sp. oral taxon 847]AMD95610.1 hypothetical protein AXF11_08515 [Leptotrichia sp. oral taxon 847]